MPISITGLRTEINNDPIGYGYAAIRATGDNQALVDALNLVRTGANGGPAIQVKRLDINPQEVLEAVDTRDFKASPTTLEGSWFESVTQYPTIRLVAEDGTDTRIMANFKRVLQNTNGSQSRVTALGIRNGSRIEQLFGTGSFVSLDDVRAALAL
jgi:hypothetical protein